MDMAEEQDVAHAGPSQFSNESKDEGQVTDLKQVLKHLGVAEYWKPPFPDTVADFEGSIVTPHSSKVREEKHLCRHLLQEILHQNSDAFRTVFREYNSGRTTAKCIQSLRGSCKIKMSEQTVEVHPQDVLLLALQSISFTFRQKIFSRLYDCKLAVPLSVPVHRSSNFAFYKFSLSNIVLHYKDSEGINHENCALKQKSFMVGCIRISDLQYSKSETVNQVLSSGNMAVHSTFFTRYSTLGKLKRSLSNGSIELAWLLPDQMSYTKEPLLFLNLRGSAFSHKTQTEFLCKTIHILVVFMHLRDIRKQSFFDLYKNISKLNSNQQIILVISTQGLTNNERENIVHDYENIFGLESDDDGPFQFITDDYVNDRFDIHEVLLGKIESLVTKLYKNEDIKSLEEAFKFLPESAKTDQDDEYIINCLNAAENVFSALNGCLSESKRISLNLHNSFCKIIDLEKDIQMNLNEENIFDLRIAQTKCREDQLGILRKGGSPFLQMFLTKLNEIPNRPNYHLHMFIECLKYQLDLAARQELPKLHKIYDEKWRMYIKCQNDVHLRSEIRQKYKEVEDAANSLTDASLGIEHLVRELGQVFEALQYNDIRYAMTSIKPEDIDQRFSFKHEELPKILADLFISGFPLEIMDGDANGVPSKWLTAVLEHAQEELGTKKILVVSVLGVQSSGKSTLLNAMFGIQFAVSAGRCTKGVFAQLVKVEPSIELGLDIEYIMAIDTEGIRAIELADGGFTRDNQLATFVVGLSDITLINIKGEDTSHMNDVLQIVIHAFLRMKLVTEGKVRSKCAFVFQNVDAVNAKQKLQVSMRKLEMSLNKVTKAAAIAEHQPDIHLFRDVIDFDAKNDIYFFPALFSGSLPMAPINKGYSIAVRDLFGSMLNTCNGPRTALPTSISHFKDKLVNLWNSIISDNFDFHLRNSDDIKAHVTLQNKIRQYTNIFEDFALDKAYKKVAESIKICNTTDELEMAFKKSKQSQKNLIQAKAVELQRDLASLYEGSPDVASEGLTVMEIYRRVLKSFEQAIEAEKQRRWLELDNHMSLEQLQAMSDKTTDFVKDKYRSSSSKRKTKAEFKDYWSKRGEPQVDSEIVDTFGKTFPNEIDNLRQKMKVTLQKSISHVYKSADIERFVIKKNQYSKKHKPKYYMNGILAKVEKYVTDTARTKETFSCAYVEYIIKIIIDDIDTHNKHSQHFMFKEHMKVDATILALRYAFPIFEKLHKNYSRKCTSLPSKKKSEKYFKDMVRTKESEEGLLIVISEAINDALKQGTCFQISKDLKDKFRKKYPTKVSFLMDFHLRFKRGEDLSKERYFDFLRNPKESAERMYLEMIDREYFITAYNGVTKYATLADKFLRKYLNSVIKTFEIMNKQDTCLTKDISLKTWCKDFQKHLRCQETDLTDFLVIKSVDRPLPISGLLSFNSKLTGIIEENANSLCKEFCDIRFRDANWATFQPGYSFSILWGCDEVCPYCLEPCIKLKGHRRKHIAAFHRPLGVVDRDLQTVEGFHFVKENCARIQQRGQSSKIHTNPNHIKLQVSKSQAKQWDLGTDFELHNYWKWLLGEHFHHLYDVAENPGTSDINACHENGDDIEYELKNIASRYEPLEYGKGKKRNRKRFEETHM